MVNTTFNSTEGLIQKLQSLQCETKLKFYKIISNFCDEMNIRRQNNTFQFQEDPLIKNVESYSKIYREVLLLMKFLQTKPQVKNMNKNYYDLYYTVIKNRDDNEIVADNYKDAENDFINFNDIIPNHYVGRKNNKEILG